MDVFKLVDFFVSVQVYFDFRVFFKYIKIKRTIEISWTIWFTRLFILIIVFSVTPRPIKIMIDASVVLDIVISEWECAFFIAFIVFNFIVFIVFSIFNVALYQRIKIS